MLEHEPGFVARETVFKTVPFFWNQYFEKQLFATARRFTRDADLVALRLANAEKGLSLRQKAIPES
jgi:hypothetical protein